MTFQSYFQELDELRVFALIEQIRNEKATKTERDTAETALCGCLSPISSWFAHRRNNQAKLAPHDPSGHSLPIESLGIGACSHKSNSEDPACTCENSDEVEHYLQLLIENVHQQVFILLLANFTWSEIAIKMDVDLKTVRLWVEQMRRILKPYAPQPSSR